METIKITEKSIAEILNENAYFLVTQLSKNENGVIEESLKRIKASSMIESLIKIGLIKQSDYQQNDETDITYIKGRPCYKEQIIEKINKMYYSSENEILDINFEGLGLGLIEGNDYTVSISAYRGLGDINGTSVTFECKAYADVDESGLPAILLRYGDEFEVREFQLYDYEGESRICLSLNDEYVNDATFCDVQVIGDGKSDVVYHKLQPEFQTPIDWNNNLFGLLFNNPEIYKGVGEGSLRSGFASEATTQFSNVHGYGCVVGAKGYKVLAVVPSVGSAYDGGDDTHITLQNISDIDDNAACTPQLEVGAKVYFLHKGDTWNISHPSVIHSIDGKTVIIGGIRYDEAVNWTPENTPLLLLSPENIENSPWEHLDDEYLSYVMGDMLTYGPDAIALTSEMVSELTANNIKVGRGRRGVALNHLGVTIGDYGISYNNRGKTIGNSAITGGQECWNRAGGGDVHGERCQTLPTARFTFVRGGFNIAYAEYGGLWGVGNYLYTRGGTGRGTYAEKDTKAQFLDFIGIGTSDTKRKNGYTFDKKGNAWWAGSLKVGGTGYDDPEAKDVATIDDVNTAIDTVMAEIIEVQKAIVGGEL